MVIREPAALKDGGQIEFDRDFHVETFRGGMNRLLLRSWPSTDKPTRVEVLFQYAQHLDIPMKFHRLGICDATSEVGVDSKFSSDIEDLAKLRTYFVSSNGRVVGTIVAAACIFGEDSEPASAQSMFFLMG